MAIRGLFKLILLLAILGVPTTSLASTGDEIFDIFDRLAHGEQPRVLPVPVYAQDTLALFYANREYRPAWPEYEYIKRVLGELKASELEGLNPEDYHYSVLRELEAEYFATRKDSARNRLHAAFDVLLSDGVLLYARHLQEGKVDPSRVEATWNFARPDFEAERVAVSLAEAIEQGTVVAKLEDFKPDFRFYRLMKDDLARYRRLQAEHEMLTLPEDTVLRPGMRHPNMRIMRTQLTRLGFATAEPTDPELFDDELKAVVKDFQKRHTLDADGIVGRDTFHELNTPYSERIDQLRINLDRIRWVQDDISDEVALVNIAGYELYFIRDDVLNWQTDVMVGTIRTQTPIFRADMSYLEFNPTWTVPRSIIGRSLYGKFSADPSYVAEHNYTLYNSDGVPVDPATIDWSQYSRSNFPFRVVQQPGPGNALGRVKFMFPNKYAVYLHDTPAKALFSKTTRAFSAGCVRVRDPMHFADLLLADETGWDRARIDEVVDSEKRTVVRFKTPVDVMLMYWTTSPDPESGLQFHPDVYKRDPKTLQLLEETPAGPRSSHRPAVVPAGPGRRGGPGAPGRARPRCAPRGVQPVRPAG